MTNVDYRLIKKVRIEYNEYEVTILYGDLLRILRDHQCTLINNKYILGREVSLEVVVEHIN